MTRIEKSEKISASAETIFKILKDYEHYSRWNPMISQSQKNGKGFIFKTPFGDQVIQKKDQIPFLKVSHTHQSPHIKETGETFRTCTECKDTNVTFYAVSTNGDEPEEMHHETEIKIQGLKHFAEFVAKGGNPENYSKIQMI